MIDTNKLKGLIVSKGLTQNKVAEILGMTPKTFYIKMKKGVFGSDEIEGMISLLDISDPVNIFLQIRSHNE